MVVISGRHVASAAGRNVSRRRSSASAGAGAAAVAASAVASKIPNG